MSRRRLTLTAGLLTAVSLLIPGPAQAADAPPSGIGQQIDTAALNAAKAAGLETFSSPAEKSYRIPRATGQGELNSRQTTAGRTIWAAATYCGAEVGAGTEASPYCKLQSAVDAAVPGDTVRVKSWTNSTGAWEAATVRTSGITIIGEGDPEFAAVNQYAGRPALTLDGVTDVTVRNLVLTAGSAPAVRITKSARVTLDGSYASSWESSGVTIDGASSDITVSRTYVNTGRWTPGVPGIAVASGATRITLAADALAASGIVADGVHGLDIAGNTIQRGCSPAVDVTGDSTAVNVQNNVILDANPVTDSSLGGFKENCAEHQPAQPWDPSVRIAAPASAGTSLDYNTFHLQDGYGTLPISVSGAPYTGAHDNLDPTLGGATGVRKDKYGAINLALVKGSTAIGTANPAAPGQLASDFYGTTPRVSRGAAEYLGTDPTLAVALTAKLTTGRAVQVTPAVTSSRTWVPVYLDWGDGTTTYVSPNGTPVTPHTYAKPGSYTVTATAVIETGDQVANSVKITTLGSHYTAYGPTRLLDTRTGLGAAAVKVAPYSSVKVKVVRRPPHLGHGGGAEHHRHRGGQRRLHHGVRLRQGPAQHLERQLHGRSDRAEPDGHSGRLRRAGGAVQRQRRPGAPDRGHRRLLHPLGVQRLHRDRARPAGGHPGGHRHGPGPDRGQVLLLGSDRGQPDRSAARFGHHGGGAERDHGRFARRRVPHGVPERRADPGGLEPQLRPGPGGRQLGDHPGRRGREDRDLQRQRRPHRRGGRRGRLLQPGRRQLLPPGHPDPPAGHPLLGQGRTRQGQLHLHAPGRRLPGGDRLRDERDRHRAGRRGLPDRRPRPERAGPLPVQRRRLANPSAGLRAELEVRRDRPEPGPGDPGPYGVIDFWNGGGGNIHLVVDVFGYYDNS
ncbi:right-handed parallel beta-helix repeat-containing protein [Kitasatospora gansuensis]